MGGGNAGGLAGTEQRRDKGGNWGNWNSIINKIHLKKKNSNYMQTLSSRIFEKRELFPNLFYEALFYKCYPGT